MGGVGVGHGEMKARAIPSQWVATPLCTASLHAPPERLYIYITPLHVINLTLAGLGPPPNSLRLQTALRASGGPLLLLRTAHWLLGDAKGGNICGAPDNTGLAELDDGRPEEAGRAADCGIAASAAVAGLE